MTTTFENAKIGDKVWDFNYGWGRLVYNENNGIMYPISVEFVCMHVVVQYNLQGFPCDGSGNPRTLFWNELKYDIPTEPERIRTKIILNDWGRRTYKTIEALRVRENCKHPVTLLTELPQMAVQMSKHNCCTLREMEFKEGCVYESKRVSAIPIKGRVFIFDEPCLKSGKQDLLRVIEGLGENNALEVHVYGELGETTCERIKTMALGRFDVFVDRRDTPFDIKQNIDANWL
jgi:hypothetical protein